MRASQSGGAGRRCLFFVPFVFHPGGEWTLDRDACARRRRRQDSDAPDGPPSMSDRSMLDPPAIGLSSRRCASITICCSFLDSCDERWSAGRRSSLPPGRRYERPHHHGRICAKESALTDGASLDRRHHESYLPDLVARSLANVVVPVGIGQDAASDRASSVAGNSAALRSPNLRADETPCFRARSLPVACRGCAGRSSCGYPMSYRTGAFSRSDCSPRVWPRHVGLGFTTAPSICVSSSSNEPVRNAELWERGPRRHLEM